MDHITDTVRTGQHSVNGGSQFRPADADILEKMIVEGLQMAGVVYRSLKAPPRLTAPFNLACRSVDHSAAARNFVKMVRALAATLGEDGLLSEDATAISSFLSNADITRGDA